MIVLFVCCVYIAVLVYWLVIDVILLFVVLFLFELCSCLLGLMLV